MKITSTLIIYIKKQQGVRFDPEVPQTIRLEFAKSNTKVSKPKQQNTSPTTHHQHSIPVHPLTGRKYFWTNLKYS